MKELIAIQSELNAPKSQTNTFGNYKFRNLEDILEAVKPLLKANKCILTISDKIIEVSGRFYVEATATITNGTDTFSTTASAREAASFKGMAESQLTGATSSYARKYAVGGLFCIDDNKDADSSKPEEKKTGDDREASFKTLRQNIHTAKDAATLDAIERDIAAADYPVKWVESVVQQIFKKRADIDAQ